MPALSYKSRFCPFVEDFSKTQTIRAFRKKNPVFQGMPLMHYYGLRTKYCRRLIPNNTCIEIKTVIILSTGKVHIGPHVERSAAYAYLQDILSKDKKKYPKGFRELTDSEREIFAWQDGFRLEDNVQSIGPDNWKMMYRWWRETHTLPFVGQLIKWDKP